MNKYHEETEQASVAIFSTFFFVPGRDVPFQLEFIVVKFLRLSNWRGRAFAKFVLGDKNQNGNKEEDNWGLKSGYQNLEHTAISTQI